MNRSPTKCRGIPIPRKKKFTVEAKSTKNKLSSVNAGRLAGHREKIGGAYTIVVTPRYVPAAKRDIYNTPNVIVLASTFAEYLYNCIDNDLRDVDYEDFDDHTGFTYQLGAGGGISLNKQISLDLSYKYCETDNTKFDDVRAEYQSHNINIGWRVSL